MQLRFVCYFEEEIHSFFEGQDDCFQEEKDNFHKILGEGGEGGEGGKEERERGREVGEEGEEGGDNLD